MILFLIEFFFLVFLKFMIKKFSVVLTKTIKILEFNEFICKKKPYFSKPCTFESINAITMLVVQ